VPCWLLFAPKLEEEKLSLSRGSNDRDDDRNKTRSLYGLISKVVL
jgi:hypothetical protein